MENKTNENCVFCKIIGGELPSWSIYEDEQFKAILDIEPASLGHVILIPKKHFQDTFFIPDEYAMKVWMVARKVATVLKEVLRCDGVNILQNNGESAGQTVFHFHVHVIPRYEGDSENICMKWSRGADVDLPSLHERLCAGVNGGGG